MSDAMDVDNAPAPLVIHFNPGKLTDLAMVSFVSDLLHYKMLEMRQAGSKEFIIGDDIEHLISDVFLPPDLEATFKELPKNMINRRTQWWIHHHGFVFSRKFRSDSMIDWMRHLVWLPDGAIDYRQTARKLLNDDELNNVQMYQLACEYCFVEDVEFLKESLTNEELNEVSKGFRTYDDAILNYWCGKLKVEPNFSNSSYHLSRVIEAIINSSRYSYRSYPKYYDEWSAILYFFKQLDNDMRLSVASTVIQACQPRFTWNLLSALTGPELDVILKGYHRRDIMKALVKERRCFEYTVLIWKRMVDVATTTHLTEIINQVNDTYPIPDSKTGRYDNNHYTHGEHICPLNDSQYKSERSYVNSLLWEMWQALSNPQKKYIVDEKKEDFIEKVLKTTDHLMDYNSAIFQLILDLLSHVDPERRLKYWNAHWPALVIGHTSHPSKLNRIMRLCIETDSEMDDLKKVIKTDYEIIAKYCERLIVTGRIKEIHNFLEFCTLDEKSIRNMKKKIIMGMPKKDLFTFLFKFSQHSSMADFYRYLEEIRFTKEKSQSFVFKIITYADNLKKMYSMLDGSMLDKNLQDITKFVEKLVPDEENLTQMKLIFFKKFRRSTAISLEVLFDIMAWCFNGDQNIVERFKKSEPKNKSLTAKRRAQESSPIFDCFYKSYTRCRQNDP